MNNHTIYSQRAADEGRAMTSDEQREDRWARLLARQSDRSRLATSYGAVNGLPREAGEDHYGLS